MKIHRCDGCMYDEQRYHDKECVERWERYKNLTPKIDCWVPDDRCLGVHNEELVCTSVLTDHME